jgi:hypothetical protein
MTISGYITEAELADRWDKSPRTLQLWRQHRQGPPWTKLGKTIIYNEKSADDWLKSQERQPVRSRRAA